MLPVSRCLFVLWLTTLAVLAADRSVSAQAIVNYQSILIGQRALGLGGAVTAVGADSSACYYNPGGLAQLRGTTVSGSLATLAVAIHEIEGGLITTNGAEDLSSRVNPEPTLFFSLTLKLGETDTDGIRRHSLGMSNFSTYSYSQFYDTPIPSDVLTESALAHLRYTDTLTWYGLSYAYRYSPGLGLGISAFLLEREFQSYEQTSVVSATLQDDGTASDAQVNFHQAYTSLDAWLLAFRLGAYWRPDERWAFGIMFQPPAWQLSASSQVGEQAMNLDEPADTAQFFSANQTGLTGESPLPMELRVGLAWNPWRNLQLTLDTSVYTPVGSSDDPVRPIGQAAVDPRFGRAPQPGYFVVPEYYSSWSFNTSFGAEGIIRDIVPIQGGVFTDLSAAPPITGPTDVRGPQVLNQIGVTLGFGVRTRHFNASLGAVSLFGWGQDYALDLSDNAEHLYQPTDVRSLALFGYLTADVTGRHGDSSDDGHSPPTAPAAGTDP